MALPRLVQGLAAAPCPRAPGPSRVNVDCAVWFLHHPVAVAMETGLAARPRPAHGRRLEPPAWP